MTIDSLKAAEATLMVLIDAEQPMVSGNETGDLGAAIARQDALRPVLGAIRDAIFCFTDKQCQRSLFDGMGLRFVDTKTEDDIDRAIRHAECTIEGIKEEQLILLFGRTLGAIEAAVDRGRGR
jgi:hypothetical protein